MARNETGTQPAPYGSDCNKWVRGGARQLYEKVLKGQRMLFGPNHTDTLRTQGKALTAPLPPPPWAS